VSFHQDQELKDKVVSSLQMGIQSNLLSGACSIMALIGVNKIIIANCGDCKAVLSRKGKACPLSSVHNANNVHERAKLLEAHPNEDVLVCTQKSWNSGWFNSVRSMFSTMTGLDQPAIDQSEGCYVKGLLQPTRSFGDFYLKDASFSDGTYGPKLLQGKCSFPYITSEPQVAIFPRSADDEFVILGSDGVWDVMSDQEVVDFVTRQYKVVGCPDIVSILLAKEILKKVANTIGISVQDLVDIPLGGQRRRLHDDISIIVVALNPCHSIL